MVQKGALLMSVPSGQRLGNYTVLRPIGQGGFADVYLSQHMYLNTYAAIKVLQSRMTEHDFAGFKAEAQTIANLTHPHIVRVLEFGKEGELPFLVMEYCSDGTLRNRHPNGTRISLTECISYIKQVASALHYAHSMKVIHRDIKPDNMLVGKDGSILLSDFGIAIAAQNSRYQSAQNLGGTLAYMAPEQFDGKVAFASDQYALGVVTYEWLSGETPFKGSPMEIIAQQFKGEIPSLRALVATLPAEVELVVLKALARDSQQRFQSVQQFAEALEQASQGTMPATLHTPSALTSTSATLKARLAQADVSTYRKDPHQAISHNAPHLATTIPGSPGEPMPASPLKQQPDPSHRNDPHQAPTISGPPSGIMPTPPPRQHPKPSTGSSQPSYPSPAYTPPAYGTPPPAYTPPVYGSPPTPGTIIPPPPPYGQAYPMQSQKKSNTGGYIAVIAVLLLALIGVGSLAWMTNIAFRSALGGAIPTTNGTTGNSGNTGTQANNLFQNDVPAKDGTFTKNITLTCGDCNDPITVTVTTITIDSTTNKMTWNLTLYNNSANTFGAMSIGGGFFFEDFSLQAATDTNKVTATGKLIHILSRDQMDDTIPPGQQITTSFAFSFIPFKNKSYTLYAKLFTIRSIVSFTPTSITFS